MNPTSSLDNLQDRIQYRFTDPDLLEEALRHSSYVNEHPHPDIRDNERLEFLGDAVVSLIISDMLMKRTPPMEEGEMTRARSRLVSESGLAEIALSLGLGAFLLLGKGEAQSKGQHKASILSDGLEAVIAAVYLDGGFSNAYTLVERLFSFRLPANGELVPLYDHKSRLQELLQQHHRNPPRYRVVDESGPDHAKIFVVEVFSENFAARGTGKNKKLAEQDAAKNALQQFDEAE